MASHVLTAEDGKLLAAAGDRRRWARFAVLLFLAMAAAFAWTSVPPPRMESLAPSVQPANNAAIAFFMLAGATFHGLSLMGAAVRRRWSGNASMTWAVYGLPRQEV